MGPLRLTDEVICLVLWKRQGLDAGTRRPMQLKLTLKVRIAGPDDFGTGLWGLAETRFAKSQLRAGRVP